MNDCAPGVEAAVPAAVESTRKSRRVPPETVA